MTSNPLLSLRASWEISRLPLWHGRKHHESKINLLLKIAARHIIPVKNWSTTVHLVNLSWLRPPRWGQVRSGEVRGEDSVLTLSVFQSEFLLHIQSLIFIFSIVPLDPRLLRPLLWTSTKHLTWERNAQITTGLQQTDLLVSSSHLVHVKHLVLCKWVGSITWHYAAIGTAWWTLWWPNTPVYTLQHCRRKKHVDKKNWCHRGYRYHLYFTAVYSVYYNRTSLVLIFW